MKDVEDLLKQVLKKAKDKDGKYLWGIEYSSDAKPGFKALVRFSKDGVQPIMFAGNTKRQLKKQLQDYLDGKEIKPVTVLFHEAQIELERSAIRFHERRIEDYENGTYSELPA